MAIEFKLPELGENIETIQVVKLRVAVGDVVSKEQPVLELETDKATVEVPSTVQGTVSEIHVAEGDEIKVGQTVMTLDGEAGTSDSAGKTGNPDTAETEAAAEAAKTPAPIEAEEKTAADEPAVSSAPASTGDHEFVIPELGENIETIQVVNVMLAVGDVVNLDQPVLELETDKATVEVPSTVAGEVTTVHVRSGDEVRVGMPVFTYRGTTPAPGGATGEAPSPDAAPAAPAPDTRASDDAEAAVREPESTPQRQRVAAAPSVRRFAREIGVDLGAVTGSGAQGRVSIDDVKAYAKALNEGGQRDARVADSGTTAPRLPPLPHFEKWGDVQRDKMSVIRRKTAEQMSLSWQTIPHVTIFDEADITELEILRKRYAPRAEAEGGKLTMSVMVVKVVAQALRVFPRFNASIDLERREVIYKKYCNVGVAVATERGLLVPVIRDTDKKNMVKIAVEITGIAERARSGRIGVDELEGGTFTVTNLGRIGGTFFTPIVNYPEVAILGIGRAYRKSNGAGESMILPLSLSFDHRIIDGADGAAFLGWVIEAIEQPLLLSLEG